MHRSKIELHNVDCLPFMKQCKDNQFDLAIVDAPYRDEKDNAPTKQMRAKLDGKMKNFGNKPTSEFWTELSSIGKANVGKKLEEADEYDRVKEIFTLMDLIEKEYGPINY